MCWRSMLPQRMKEILQRTLTHAHTASAGCLPLNLLNARFRCVSLYSRVGGCGRVDLILLLFGVREEVFTSKCYYGAWRRACGSSAGTCVTCSFIMWIYPFVCLEKRTWIICFGIFVNNVTIWHWASVPLVGALCTLRCDGALRALPLILKIKTGVQRHCLNPFLVHFLKKVDLC